MWRRCIYEVVETKDGCSMKYKSEVFAKGLKKY